MNMDVVAVKLVADPSMNSIHECCCESTNTPKIKRQPRKIAFQLIFGIFLKEYERISIEEKNVNPNLWPEQKSDGISFDEKSEIECG